ncbi:beta-ribofuranosylaminobenzene 5'-phosphate synthase family protein [Lacipirellula parvula]|uniref:beta-ribofuranosylaminobenzene 5'-phosphate synthase family protein n=1 Tax=Lacipirellula parvula TaxID=2650471 RepID=UPI0015624A82|nr:beta-ribofuranosylaminobenzene 5'-phosphate synthase family protein [Lacipirellula parvula]
MTISTPSRLHFGLLRFEQTDGPSFGGLGMMIAEPRCTLRLATSTEWQATGPDAERALAHARQSLEHLVAAGQRPAGAYQQTPQALHIEVLDSIPPHQGLGSGTQLALAVAAGVRSLYDLAPASAEDLAAMVGRGRRSAIGCHGFLQGGLLYELGSLPNEPLGRLAQRVEVPAEWRVILVAASTSAGLSGEPEVSAFGQLPPVPAATTARLAQLAEQSILPATWNRDLTSFGEALFEYGRLAGECFASVQGGPYASAEIAACVETLRSLGVRGVGQSSWGPTVFAFAADEAHADEIVTRMRAMTAWQGHAMQITRADNRGATIDSAAV